MLYAFSGLPGVGKTTLAQHISKQLGAVYLRVDTVEQCFRDLCKLNVQGEGYRMSYMIISDNLCLGNSVVFDSCNPIELTRNEIESVAKKAKARCLNIEVVCTNLSEHQKRVEKRQPNISGLQLPTWFEVQQREFHPWVKEHITVDTAGKSVDESVRELLSIIEKM